MRTHPLRLLHLTYRFTRIVIHIVAGALRVLLQFPRVPLARQQAEIARWARRLVGLTGAHLQVRFTGDTPTSPDWWRSTLLVGNHISWLDIHVLHACVPARFVAKSDIAAWPLIGRMTAASRALFVERTRRRDVLRINQMIADALGEGDCVVVFPEGTTTEGEAVLPFHANLFEAALHGEATRVRPFALRYLNADGSPSLAPAYVGDQSLLDSVWRSLSGAPFQAELHFLPPLTAGDFADRRALAQAAHAAVAGAVAAAVAAAIAVQHNAPTTP